MHPATIITLFLFTFQLFIPATITQHPLTPSPAAGGCVDSAFHLSPCLPYISAPPNNLSDQPSSQCCDIFNGGFDSDDAECLNYFVGQNSILDIPLNVTKLLSLQSICSDSEQKNDPQLSMAFIWFLYLIFIGLLLAI